VSSAIYGFRHCISPPIITNITIWAHNILTLSTYQQRDRQSLHPNINLQNHRNYQILYTFLRKQDLTSTCDKYLAVCETSEPRSVITCALFRDLDLVGPQYPQVFPTGSTHKVLTGLWYSCPTPYWKHHWILRLSLDEESSREVEGVGRGCTGMAVLFCCAKTKMLSDAMGSTIGSGCGYRWGLADWGQPWHLVQL